MKVAEPDFVVEERKGENMVDERFRFACLWGNTEYLQQHEANPPQDIKPSATTAHIFPQKTENKRQETTHMREHLLDQPPPLRLLESPTKAQQPSTPLQTIPSHFQLVHRMHVLDVHLHGGPVGRFSRPEVEILVPTSFKVESVVAVVEVCEFGEEGELVFGVEF